MAKLDERGREVLDSTPVAMPIGFERPPSLQEQMLRLIRSEELRRYAENRGEETFEEADDFDVGDDYDPTSPYEVHFDHEQNIERLRHELEARKRQETSPRQPATPDHEEEEPVRRPAKGEKKGKRVAAPPADDSED